MEQSQQSARPNYLLATLRLSVLAVVIGCFFIPIYFLIYLPLRYTLTVCRKLNWRYRLEMLHTHSWLAFVQHASGITCRVKKKLPKATLIISSHSSYLDIIVYAANFLLAFVGEASLAKLPWPFGRLFRTTGQISIDQDKDWKGVEETGQQILKRLTARLNVWVSLSDGTHHLGGLEQPKKSFAVWAYKDSVTIVPCYIAWRVHTPNGLVERDIVSPKTRNFWVFARHFFRLLGLKVSVTIHFGQPIMPHGQSESAYVREVYDTIVRLAQSASSKNSP